MTSRKNGGGLSWIFSSVSSFELSNTFKEIRMMQQHTVSACVMSALALVLGAGCTSISVQPVDRSANVNHVCIEENRTVVDDNFLTVLRDGFHRHRISTEVFSSLSPLQCKYILTYTALWSWDFGVYLTESELKLKHQSHTIAFAKYRLRQDGGLSLMKWQGTKTKMDPVIDELLKAY